MADECLLCSAERVTPWLHEDDDCWVAECLVCRTPMVVWRTHGLPDAELETALLERLERIAVDRYADSLWRLQIESLERSSDKASAERVRRSWQEMMDELGVA